MERIVAQPSGVVQNVRSFTLV